MSTTSASEPKHASTDPSTYPSTDDSTGTVLVVGAGPVGLTLSALLREAGVTVDCVDRASGPSARSRALLVWPRTLEVLGGLVPRAQLRERSRDVEHFRYYSAGRPVARVGFAPEHRPVVLPQPDVE
nr:FAD-dependent monooxygenase [Micromonospora sp. DSM 115978]